MSRGARAQFYVIWVRSDEWELAITAKTPPAGRRGPTGYGFCSWSYPIHTQWGASAAAVGAFAGIAVFVSRPGRVGDGRVRPAQRPLTARRRGIAVSPAIGHHRGYQRRAGEGAP
jgi:hypothetical protein